MAFVPLILLTDWEAQAAAAIERHGLEPTTSYLLARELLRADSSTPPFVLVAVLQPLSPDIAAFLVAALCFGGPGAVALLRRYRFWAGRVGWRRGLPVWGACVALVVAFSQATAGLNALLLPQGSFSWAKDLSLGGFLFALAAATDLDGGVAEETGWRGFALPLFQSLYASVTASVVLGLIWAVWHWPLKIDLLFESGWGYFLTYSLLLTLRMVLLSLVVILYNGVGGSLISMHRLHNDLDGLMGRLIEDSFAIMVRGARAEHPPRGGRGRADPREPGPARAAARGHRARRLARTGRRSHCLP